MKIKNIDKLLVQNILHYGDIGIHVINTEKKTVVYNETMAQIEGLERKEVLEKEMLSNFPSLDKDSSTLIKVLKTGKPILNRTQTYFNFKGEEITSINSTIGLYEDEVIVGALEIANNITQLRKLSHRMLDLQGELKTSKAGKGGDNSQIRRYGFEDIIGRDEKLLRAKEIAKKASKSSSSVLIYGDTGTGKELFAQSIHYDGIRRNQPFIAQNCAAIPESLLEGILFGTEKGGFTGATERQGIFEQASGGTLMLDEINSMSLSLQAKLLRVLQEGYIRRVGGTKDIAVDVRILATTNEEAYKSLENGSIRKDLFYRLNVIYIPIPSLKERKRDIYVLCEHFIDKYNSILDKNIQGLSEGAKDLFFKHDWPGNVRELSNVIEGAMNIVADGKEYLDEDDFLSSFHLVEDRAFKSSIIDIKKMEDKSLPEIIDDIEKDIIASSLEKNMGNITKTAEELGIKRQTLQYKLKKYKL